MKNPSNPSLLQNIPKYFDSKVKDLDPTDDGESCQKPHGATNQTQLDIEFDLLISLHVVESGRVEEDLDNLEGCVGLLDSWGGKL